MNKLWAIVAVTALTFAIGCLGGLECETLSIAEGAVGGFTGVFVFWFAMKKSV